MPRSKSFGASIFIENSYISPSWQTTMQPRSALLAPPGSASMARTSMLPKK